MKTTSAKVARRYVAAPSRSRSWLMQHMANPASTRTSQQLLLILHISSPTALSLLRLLSRTSDTGHTGRLLQGSRSSRPLRNFQSSQLLGDCFLLRSQAGLTAELHADYELAQCESTAQPSGPQPISSSKHSEEDPDSREMVCQTHPLSRYDN